MKSATPLCTRYQHRHQFRTRCGFPAIRPQTITHIKPLDHCSQPSVFEEFIVVIASLIFLCSPDEASSPNTATLITGPTPETTTSAPSADTGPARQTHSVPAPPAAPPVAPRPAGRHRSGRIVDQRPDDQTAHGRARPAALLEQVPGHDADPPTELARQLLELFRTPPGHDHVSARRMQPLNDGWTRTRRRSPKRPDRPGKKLLDLPP